MLGLISTSCGNLGNTVNVRLITGLEMTSCTQKNLYAIVNVSTDRDADPLLETYRIPMSLAFDTLNNYTVFAQYVRDNGTFPPIKLPIPKGTNVDIGIIGSIVATKNVLADGTCGDFTPGPTPAPYNTSSVLAYRTINVNAPIDVPLKTWVIPANGAAAPSPAPAGGNYACLNEMDGTENCPQRAFMAIRCASCTSASYHIKLEYAPGRQNGIPVIQWLPAQAFSGPNNQAFVPEITPMKVTLINSSLGPLGTVEVLRNGWQNQTDGTEQQLYSISSTPISLIRYPYKPTGPIGAFSLNPLNVAGTTINFNWSMAQGATNYELFQDGTSIVPSLSVLATTWSNAAFTGNSTYSYYVRATNALGSTPAISNTVTYKHITAWGSAPTASMGTSSFTVNFTPPAGPLGTQTLMLNCNKIAGGGAASITQSIASGQNITGLTTGAQYNCFIDARNSQFGFSQSPTFIANVN
jgi:hypothetical protein